MHKLRARIHFSLLILRLAVVTACLFAPVSFASLLSLDYVLVNETSAICQRCYELGDSAVSNMFLETCLPLISYRLIDIDV